MKSEWKVGRIKDFAEVKGGKRLPKGEKLVSTPTDHPYIRIRDLGKSKILELTSDYEFVDDITQKKISKYIVNSGDILISVVGTIGLIGIVGQTLHNANQTENCDKIVNIKGLEREYLYYYLISSFGQDEIRKRTVGAVQPKLPLKNVLDIEIRYPDIDTQRKIVQVLSSLDDKIELNNAINKNLEEQAQAIFKSWFVDCEPFGFIQPSDWYQGIVDDLAQEIICGKTPSTKKKEYYGDNVPFITIPDMHDCVYAITTERSLSKLGEESQPRKTLPANSVAVSCIGTAGLVVLVSRPSQTNQQINSIVPKTGFSPYYIYLLMKTMSETINRLGQSGSTIVNLNKTQFGKMEVLVPSVSAMNEFDITISPLFEMILANQRENISLIALRDSLLPKLMSGKIDVSNINI